MTWRYKDGDRAAARQFLQDRNQEALDALSAAAGLTGVPYEEYEAMLREELAKLDHETHEWWGAPCNCQGHLN